MCRESDEEMFSYLIGALADGSIYFNKKYYVYRVSYYQKSKEYLDRCIEPRIEHLFQRRGHFYFDTRKGVNFYEITSKEIFQYFEKALESYKAETNRRVPLWIRNGEVPIRIAFIRGFFDAEGFYYINPQKYDYRIRFGQSEYYILEDIRNLVEEQFECSEVYGPYQSKVGVKPYYELHIYGLDQINHFHNKIRPCHPEKQLNLIF